LAGRRTQSLQGARSSLASSMESGMSPIALSDAIIVTYMTIHMAWSPDSKAIHKTHHRGTISFEGGAIRLNYRRAQKCFECDFLATKARPANTVSRRSWLVSPQRSCRSLRAISALRRPPKQRRAGLRQCSTLWRRTIILKAGLSVTLRDRWE